MSQKCTNPAALIQKKSHVVLTWPHTQSATEKRPGISVCFRHYKDVAHPWFGLNVLWIARVGLDLAAQPLDDLPQHVVLSLVSDPPYAIEEIFGD